jgi:hypothetical protein
MVSNGETDMGETDMGASDMTDMTGLGTGTRLRAYAAPLRPGPCVAHAVHPFQPCEAAALTISAAEEG